MIQFGSLCKAGALLRAAALESTTSFEHSSAVCFADVLAATPLHMELCAHAIEIEKLLDSRGSRGSLQKNEAGQDRKNQLAKDAALMMEKEVLAAGLAAFEERPRDANLSKEIGALAALHRFRHKPPNATGSEANNLLAMLTTPEQGLRVFKSNDKTLRRRVMKPGNRVTDPFAEFARAEKFADLLELGRAVGLLEGSAEEGLTVAENSALAVIFKKYE